jgi:hypothetical protein
VPGWQSPDDLGLAPSRNQPSSLISEQEQQSKQASKASKLLAEYDRRSLDRFLSRVLPVCSIQPA